MQLRDVFLGAGGPIDPKARPVRRQPSNEKGGLGRHLSSIAMLTGLPLLVFALVSSVTAFLEVWATSFGRVVVVLCALFGVLCLYINYTDITKRPFYLHLGLLVFLAIGLGLVIGRWIFEAHSWQYASIAKRASYKDVSPTAEAEAFGDAGAIQFQPSTLVDTRRTMGRKTPYGEMYCVAPILDSTMMQRADFWAAGVDCCETLSQFFCGDVEDAAAKTGIVVPRSSLSTWVVTPAYEEFNKTVHQAAAAHRLTTPENPVIVYWARDRDDWKLRFLRDSLVSWVHSWQGFFVFALVLAVMLHFGSRPKGKTFKTRWPGEEEAAPNL